MPSTNQSLRRLPHRKKCTCTANLFVGHQLGTVRVLPLTPTHQRLRLELCSARGNWTVAELNHAAFCDESRFNLSSDDNRVRMWRPHDERVNPAFALQRHTTLTAGVMLWGAFFCNTWLPPVLIRDTMTA
ncbi:transposable element Tcb1 transposase [Trichonephila clavipes]|nr:transposable element Tcb1 transposase [Trichonephila clavipes]